MQTNPGLVAAALKTLRTVSRKKHARSTLKDLHDPIKAGPGDDDDEDDDEDFDAASSPFVRTTAAPPSALTRLASALPRSSPE